MAESGCRVAALARRIDRLTEIANSSSGAVLPFEHDVTQFGVVAELFQDVTKALGGLDLVIYCAGVMPDVGKQEYNFEKDKEIVDVNLLGAIAWLNQAAIRLGKVGKGSIVGIGSVAGDRGRSGQPVYNTSKAALATYMEALRNRLGKTAVAVVTIKPGPTETPMTNNLGIKRMMSAQTAASLILRKAHRNGEHYLSPVHRIIFFVIRIFPSPIFRKLGI